MVRMVPVDLQRHSGKGWRPEAGYGFASQQSLVPLSTVEFGKAAVAMPIAFMENARALHSGGGDFASRGAQFVCVGHKASGSAGMCQRRCAAIPFAWGRAKMAGGRALLIDEDSGWVIDATNVAAILRRRRQPIYRIKNMS